MTVPPQEQAPNAELVERVTAQRDRLLRFLASRVEDPETAEDILQVAYLKVIERGSEIRKDESTVAWFYRILRNAVTDHYRCRASRVKAHEAFVAEMPGTYEPKIKATVCECIGDIIDNLKPGYRSAIEQVDLAENSVEDYAHSEHISPNNAYVRLHRARKAVVRHLKTVCGACAEHKCLDCTCRHARCKVDSLHASAARSEHGGKLVLLRKERNNDYNRHERSGMRYDRGSHQGYWEIRFSGQDLLFLLKKLQREIRS
jgi:RNA polymerase sigma factor (sigma-70 family)